MTEDKILVDKKYIESLQRYAKFYSNLFIFSLSFFLTSIAWFCYESLVYTFENKEIFWIGVISLVVMFMCVLGWLFIVDYQPDKEEEN